jgi:hypothetical protein
MMPDLPNVDLERDIEQFIEFFENPAFRPDGLKLYPTLVIRGTGNVVSIPTPIKLLLSELNIRVLGARNFFWSQYSQSSMDWNM